MLYYMALISNVNGTILREVVVPENKSFAHFNGLSPYTKYEVGVIGANSHGQAYQSPKVTVWTEEGGKLQR